MRTKHKKDNTGHLHLLKRSYENKSTALEAILKIMNKTGIVQYAEKCDRCGKWHTYRFCAVPCR